ncbi:MAG: FAD-dependent monooxygenase, partial [Pseudomonadota bacterium]
PFHEHLPGLSNVNYIWFDGGTFSLLRLPALWRASLYADAEESVGEATQPAAVEAKLQRIVPRDEPYPVGEIRPYRIHQRILNDYRVGRVLFAGDAAHLNSPSGGMGMNGGIHDAVCAVATLVPVWRGDAPLEALDRYTRQRRPIARDQILKQSHANRSRMQQRDALTRRAELERLRRIADDPVLCRNHLLTTSMIEGLRRAEEIA